MKTLHQLGKEYEETHPFVSKAECWREGYLSGFRDHLAHNQEYAAKEHSRKMNLERVYSFHQEAIKLIERAMKELE